MDPEWKQAVIHLFCLEGGMRQPRITMQENYLDTHTGRVDYVRWLRDMAERIKPIGQDAIPPMLRGYTVKWDDRALWNLKCAPRPKPERSDWLDRPVYPIPPPTYTPCSEQELFLQDDDLEQFPEEEAVWRNEE